MYDVNVHTYTRTLKCCVFGVQLLRFAFRSPHNRRKLRINCQTVYRIITITRESVSRQIPPHLLPTPVRALPMRTRIRPTFGTAIPKPFPVFPHRIRKMRDNTRRHFLTHATDIDRSHGNHRHIVRVRTRALWHAFGAQHRVCLSTFIRFPHLRQ